MWHSQYVNSILSYCKTLFIVFLIIFFVLPKSIKCIFSTRHLSLPAFHDPINHYAAIGTTQECFIKIYSNVRKLLYPGIPCKHCPRKWWIYVHVPCVVFICVVGNQECWKVIDASITHQLPDCTMFIATSL